MFKMRILCLSVLACLLLGMPVILPAQEVLIEDPRGVFVPADQSRMERLERTRGLPQVQSPQARTIATAPFPFFEDFSGSSLELDTNRWLASPVDDFVPTISNIRAVHPPSKGVLTLDGATYFRKKHAAFFENNYADFIESQDIDLSTYLPSDSVILSFYFQQGGMGDPPDEFDSLLVAFDTTGNGEYRTVWSTIGTGVADTSFTLIKIVLDDSVYFHSGFKFRFENFGSLNGELDLWHIDYIYLDENRQLSDSNFADVSPIGLSGSPLGDYTMLPRHFYDGAARSDSLYIEMSNAGGPAANFDLTLDLSDPVGANTLVGTINLTPPQTSIQPFANQDVFAGLFSVQTGNLTQEGTLRVTARSNSSGDTRPENDTVQVDFRVDSLVGYDDGQPDASYGLTTNRSFCQEFRIPEPDTISAVWIAFAPTMNFNPVISQSTCMDGETFKLTLWDTLAPDLFSTQQGTGMVINYDTAVNYYQRFTFINPPVVDTIFWMGIRQSTNKVLGVGFDKNGTPGRVYYEDQSAEFVQSSQQGVLMIRVEFANIRDEMASTLSGSDPTLVQGLFYPNPVRNGELHLRLDGTPVRSGEVRIIDLHGRMVHQTMITQPGTEIDMQLPANLSSGIYLADFKGIDLAGKQIALRKRLLIQNP